MSDFPKLTSTLKLPKNIRRYIVDFKGVLTLHHKKLMCHQQTTKSFTTKSSLSLDPTKNPINKP
jgi:hypothetical protein